MRTLIFLIFGFINASYGSMGDMTPYHLRCLDKCRLKNCTSNESLQRYSSSQSWPEYALGWTCYEALCKYPCMWSTVDYFRLTLKRPVPQFYGKWPFIKVFGIQAGGFFGLCFELDSPSVFNFPVPISNSSQNSHVSNLVRVRPRICQHLGVFGHISRSRYGFNGKNGLFIGF